MIAIIGAMDVEVTEIQNCMDQYEVLMKRGIEFTIGKMATKDVVIMKSGVGKGNAAMATTILLEHFDVSAIINIGTAGGLKKYQNVLDLVVSKRVVQHDFDTSAIDGKDGKGLWFDADESLVSLCEQILSDETSEVYVGDVASGDLFVAGESNLLKLIDTYPSAMCAEMEAGAIAQVATHYQIPFVVIRSLSDVAFHKDSQLDFPVYVSRASVRSARFTRKMVEALAE